MRLSNPTKTALAQLSDAELVDAFTYLDALRNSGRANMFGAAAFVHREHGLPKDRADAVTLAWMESFDPESSTEARVAAVRKALA